jgi:signal transduction histidine kinase
MRRPGPARVPRQAAGTGVVLVCAGAAALVQVHASTGAVHVPRPLAALAAAAAVVPLAWRHRYPVTVFGVCGALAWTLMVVTAAPAPAGAAAVVALCTVTTLRGRLWSLACCAVTLGGTAAWIALVRPDRLRWAALALPAIVVAGAWLVGDNVRVRRAHMGELRERALRTQADRQADTQRATAEERARIARELHDVVAHHVGVIAVQAGAARLLSQGSRDQDDLAGHGGGGVAQASHDALTTIEATSRQALSELRRLLGVLRSGPLDPALDLAPQPGLHLLCDLIEQVRSAGLPVRLHVHGASPTLSSGADLSAYRIVQEALTNVMKHRGLVPTDVTVTFTSTEVGLEITDRPDLPGPPEPPVEAVCVPPATQGHGLIGMRERVAMLGGQFRATALPDGGFTVSARIPAGEPV